VRVDKVFGKINIININPFCRRQGAKISPLEAKEGFSVFFSSAANADFYYG